MKKETILKLITYAVIFVFLVFYIMQGNYEFISYNILALLFFWIVLHLQKKYDLPFIIVAGFCVWLFLHMFGGLDIPNRVYGIILFDLIGEPFHILKYDQLVHFYCYVVVGAMFYYIVKKTSKKMNWVVGATAVQIGRAHV